ncbi:MAG: hypothetical protein KAT04_04245 [Methylococcales bacterium]|nr:hypothetical protein [Methylococcales bacterium]
MRHSISRLFAGFIKLNLLLVYLYSNPLSAKNLSYLYLNASEGASSGGHTALRFGDETFHFQNFDGGIVRSVKQSSVDFDYEYRYLDNRTLYQAKIELNDHSYNLLRDYFNRQFLIQNQQDKYLREIEINLNFFYQLKYPEPLEYNLSVTGAGLFSEQAGSNDVETVTNKALIKKIQQNKGNDFLTESLVQLKQQINSYQPDQEFKKTVILNDSKFLSVPYSFASRYIDTVGKLLFLQTLNNNIPLNPQNYFTPKDEGFILSQIELTQLKQFKTYLTEKLINLLSSSRTDWGSSAFVIYARILSISHSIESGRLVFLDTYLMNSPTITASELNKYSDLFKQQKQQALAYLLEKKQQLLAKKNRLKEINYSEFEMLANYYYERERGLNNKTGIRINGEQRLPSKALLIPEKYHPNLTDRQLEQAIQNLEYQEQQFTQHLHNLYRYDVITRNCVTEIAHTIKQSNINDEQVNKIAESLQKSSFSFIPVNSFNMLSEQYDSQSTASFRLQKMNDMYDKENDFWVYLREMNTVTARDYKFNEKDAPFLFFTDESILLRPIFGVANLITATGTLIYGSLALPFDSGKAFNAGVLGIVMSLPELAFFNIRKGSYKHLTFSESSRSETLE